MPALLSDAIFWIAVVCCAAAQLLILRSVFAARGAGPASSLPPVRRPLEIAWALLPAVALALVLAMTWRAMHPAPRDVRTLPPLPADQAEPLT